MNQPIIRTQNLSRSFKTVQAVSQLDLQIPPGIVFGFLGPNGSGKTTTIRLLLGLLEPSEGSSEVFGLDSLRQSGAIREQTGALLEHTGLYERLSAEDNLELYGRIYHLPSAQRKARIKDLLMHIELWERRHEVVGNWSRGMKQKLAIARALIHQPRLIFLDEPTAGLDPLAANALREDLERLVKESQVTVFLTTHNLVEAERLCQQVAVIQKGKLLATGRPDELRGRRASTQVEITGSGFTDEVLAQVRANPEVVSLQAGQDRLVLNLKNGASPSEIIARLVMNGARLEEVRKNKASLEDIFLEMMEEEEGKKES